MFFVLVRERVFVFINQCECVCLSVGCVLCVGEGVFCVLVRVLFVCKSVLCVGKSVICQ